MRVIANDESCAKVTAELDEIDKHWNNLSVLLKDKAEQLQVNLFSFRNVQKLCRNIRRQFLMEK